MSLKGRKPTVFVSSTCYDLKQIRGDLKNVIEKDLGFEAMLSEYNSFPIDPSLSTVENCLRVVEERVDIFLLVIGGRYGSTLDNGKSVTNLEYLRAKAKGIPIYVFVDKRILSNISLWRDNPSMNFTAVVDNPNLFAFVDELMTIDNVWVYEFELANEIAERLKYQIAYLFLDSLNIRKKTIASQISEKVLNTGPNALQIVLEKPLGWEYRFFSQVLSDRINDCIEFKRDVEYKIFLEFKTKIDDYNKLFDWISEKNLQLIRVVEALPSLINDAFNLAIGEPGEPSDLEFLIYIANKIAAVYKTVIDWEIDLMSTSVPEDTRKLVTSLSKASKSIIRDIEKFNTEFAEGFGKIPANVSNYENYDLKIKLEIIEPDFTEFYAELDVLKEKIGIL